MSGAPRPAAGRSPLEVSSHVLRAAAIAALVQAPGPGARGQEIDQGALRAYTRVLADDSLAGRGTASAGEAIAARYLGARLAELGLRPVGGGEDYRLPVPLIAYLPGPGTRMELREAGSERVLRPTSFYHPGGSPAAFHDFSGPLVYGGPTPGALERLEATELAGRVVLLGPPWDGIGEVEMALDRRGVSGLLEAIPGPVYDRLRIVRGPTRFSLREQVSDPIDQSPVRRVVIGPDALAALGMEPPAGPGSMPEAPTLGPVRVRVALDFRARDTLAHNVAALLPGRDPERADEVVAYVAHYDHVGIGEPTAGDSIWNGFLDNAAGVSILLEVARALRAAPPARSVLFLFTTAEEQGLLGANWFVRHPPIPLERIVAVINIDGGAPAVGTDRWQLAGGPESAVRARAAAALRADGAAVSEVPLRPDSDHWPFHLAGVPALFLLPGKLVAGARPHTPDDEFDPAFPFVALAAYAERALIVGRALADPDP